MIAPIAWKEWHEQRWRLTFGTVMLVGLIGSLATAHIISAAEVFAILWCASAVVLPLYSAMGVFAPEQTAGTFTFYASKPAKPLAVFMTKWFFGWLNVVVPVIAAFSFAMYFAGDAIPRLTAPDAENLRVMLICLCFGTILYTMTCCFASFRSSEAFVGLTGLLVLLFMTVYPMALSYILHDRLHMSTHEHPILQQILFCLSPLFLFDGAHSLLHQQIAYITYAEQGVIFLLTLSFGYWKWRRHW
jgi:ABC-type transport system involved in multi-copper enzyme maturation permease subunit